MVGTNESENYLNGSVDEKNQRFDRDSKTDSFIGANSELGCSLLDGNDLDGMKTTVDPSQTLSPSLPFECIVRDDQRKSMTIQSNQGMSRLSFCLLKKIRITIIRKPIN